MGTSAMDARGVKDALHRRYDKPSQGRPGEQYVCIEEARSGAGFSGNAGQCDFLAINTWRSRGMELIGHEVKVSMSDWKAELANPAKAERFARYCRRWYVAVPSALASEIKHEVPPTWGLLSISASGRATETVKPTVREEPDAVPAWWWVGWLAQIDRQHKRRLPHMIREGMDGERERMREEIEQRLTRKAQRESEQIAAVRENADEIQRVTGIDLRFARPHDLRRLRDAWNLLRELPYLDGLVRNLRGAADALEAARPIEDDAADPAA